MIGRISPNNEDLLDEDGYRKCKFCGWVITGVRSHRGYICAVCEHGRRRYNMDRLQMLDVLESQGGICLLCDTQVVLADRSEHYNLAHVDHFHFGETAVTTDRGGQRDERYICGILCAVCNVFIGAQEERERELPDDFADRVAKYIARTPLVYHKMGPGEISTITVAKDWKGRKGMKNIKGVG